MAATATTVGCAPNGPPSGVVGVIVEDSCRPGIEIGSGAQVAPGVVLTSAHVIAGAGSISVVGGGRSVPGRIVGFDPEMDLAYLAADGLPGLPLTVSSHGVEAGDTGIAYVVRDGSVVELPVTIERRVDIRTEDVYLDGETRRPGFELEAVVQGGDSGAAIVVDGKLVAVVWAHSQRSPDRAWAIDPDRAGDLIAEQLRTGVIGDEIDLTRCR